MRLTTRPTRYSGHELAASLSLSLPPLHGVLPSPPTEPSGYQYLCRFAFVGIGTTRQKIRHPSSPPPPALSAYRIAIFRPLVSVRDFLIFLGREREREKRLDG